jgi:putative endonuclease
MTSNLKLRATQHKSGHSGFSSRYRTTKLVWFEVVGSPQAAIEREKAIKAGSRAKKIALIEAMNPAWVDLSFTL